MTEKTQQDLIMAEVAERKTIAEIAGRLAAIYCETAEEKGLDLKAHPEVSTEFNKIIAGTYAPKCYCAPKFYGR